MASNNRWAEDRQDRPWGRDRRTEEMRGWGRDDRSRWGSPDYGRGDRFEGRRQDRSGSDEGRAYGDEGFARSEADRWEGSGEWRGENRDAAGWMGGGPLREERRYARDAYGARRDNNPPTRWNQGASWTDRSSDRDYGEPYGSDDRYGRGRDRDFFDKASDEVASWFGDRDAERRRKEDQYRGVAPKGYTRSDDRIREDVSDRLTDDPYIDASNIEVAVSGSEVTLSGTVPNRDQRRRAEDVAEMVSGTTHVQNNLRVQQATGSDIGETAFGRTSSAAPGGMDKTKTVL